MIRYRLPFIERGIRKVFEQLNVPLNDQDAYSCCPEPNGIKNSDHFLHNLTAIRNVALSERDGHDILTACNGCFETLKGSRSEALVDPHLKQRINETLAPHDLQFEGSSDIMHVLEFFHRKIGTGTISDLVTRPLEGLKVGVHYGCHFLRPSNKIQTDNPIDPHIFDELVNALGGRSVDYDDKMLCCGGSMDRAGNPTVGLDMIKNKLDKMVQAGVEAIVVCCPQCFLQFDLGQDSLRKLDYEYNLPVFYYTELLGLALGLQPEDLGLQFHRQDPHVIFEKLEKRARAKETVAREFDIDFLKKCYECAACNNDCPPARFSDFDPQSIIGKLLTGELEEVIQDPMIWWCQDCYLCYELCPFKTGLVDIFTKLRNMAQERGIITPGFKSEFKKFVNTGLVAKYSVSRRKQLDLETNRPELDDLKEMIRDYTKSKKIQCDREKKERTAK